MQLLRLRYFQLKRDLGIWLFIIAGGAFYFCLAFTAGNSFYGFVIAGMAALSIYLYHTNRKDRGFMHHYLEHAAQQVLLMYNLTVLPVSIALLFNAQWQPALLLHLCVSAISWLRPLQTTGRLVFMRRLVPPQQFEWISGLRKNFYPILVLLLAAVILSPVKLFGLVALFLLNSLFLGFYGFSEPLLMLNPESLSPEDFLGRKINYLVKMVMIINSPLLLVNALFNPESAWFNLCFLMALLLLAACVIYIKYANYRPNAPQGFHLDFLILFGSLLLPYLLPLSFFLYYSNRKKAIAQLKHYHYDHGSHPHV